MLKRFVAEGIDESVCLTCGEGVAAYTGNDPTEIFLLKPAFHLTRGQFRNAKKRYTEDILWCHIDGCLGRRFVSQELGNTQEGGAVIFASLGAEAKQQKEQERRSGEQPTGQLHREPEIGIAEPLDGRDLTDVRKVVMRVSPGYPWLKRDTFVGDVDAIYADRNGAYHF